MRIGTWNLEGKWSPEHRDLLTDAACDVWLLTEVNRSAEIEGYARHCSDALMGPTKWWAGVFSRRPLSSLPDPHLASAAAVIDGITYCSSILPWRGSGGGPTWPGDGHAGRTEVAVAALVQTLPTQDLVWGGDWNHSLSGADQVGSHAGRTHVLAAVEKLGLQVLTAGLQHRKAGLLSIDHVAVPSDWHQLSATVVPTTARLSDHDCYVVEVDVPVRSV